MPDTNQSVPNWRIAPCFLVDDVVATANFYRDKLGFGYDEFGGEQQSFCMVYRDGIVIMLCQHAAGMRSNGSVDTLLRPRHRSP